jgi:deoxyribonuclease (pyrimidine dimer)
MTRINTGIRAKELPDKLLLAELREIKRIPNVIRQGKYNMNGQPEEFTLGTGHVKFFYDKLEYLLNRYNELRWEALYRGFNVSDWSDAWNGVPNELMNDYDETSRDRELLIERIKEKGFELRREN